VAAQLAPVRAAAVRHGLATPIADHLVALVTEVEQGHREIGPDLANELSATAQQA
jgi:2-dehydropantoate 2-reductase